MPSAASSSAPTAKTASSVVLKRGRNTARAMICSIVVSW